MVTRRINIRTHMYIFQKNLYITIKEKNHAKYYITHYSYIFRI